uniref:BPTI/Kunitz inhibitor domain-containing protein n=1 Tax=Capra hircus TaxID=9925 RepID=A0A452GB17_CAPHI
MNRLCLSAALLFLLVILMDSTPLNTHHVQDEGRSISGAKYKNHTAEESPTLNIQQLILTDSRPAFCLEPKVVGHGKASMPRYFYNAKTGHCEPFTYSGLGRNKNNFLTLEDCIKTCGQGAGSLGHAKSVSQKM